MDLLTLYIAAYHSPRGSEVVWPWTSEDLSGLPILHAYPIKER